MVYDFKKGKWIVVEESLPELMPNPEPIAETDGKESILPEPEESAYPEEPVDNNETASHNSKRKRK